MAQRENKLLTSFSAGALSSILPHLRSVDLAHGFVLFDVGDEISQVTFPTFGIVSLLIPFRDGEAVEAGLVGNTGAAGAGAALSQRRAISKGTMQVPGAGVAIEAGRLRQIADEYRDVRDALARHEQFLYAQAQQSAACNAVHEVKQRLCRWLMQAHTLYDMDVLPLTQEYLAQMLGVRRTSVTAAAVELQEAQAISYSRGNIKILNAETLRASACECGERVIAQHGRMLFQQS